ncbi:MAG: hypothetical protein WD512_09085, partial [Candidatus Paceibacterota bacterium]
MCTIIKYMCLFFILLWYLKSPEICSCQSILYKLRKSLSKDDDLCEIICEIPSLYDIVKANKMDRKIIKFYEEHY